MINAVDANNQLADTPFIDPEREKEVREERVELKLIEILDQHTVKFMTFFRSKTVSTLMFLLFATPIVVLSSHALTSRSIGENRAAAANQTPVLQLVPAEIQVNPGKSFAINIFVNTNDFTLNEAKIELSYDPKSIAVNEVKPSSLLGNTVVSQINPDDGKILLQLNTKCTPTPCKAFRGSGSLAVIFVSAKSEARATPFQVIPSTALSQHTELIMVEPNAPTFTASSSTITIGGVEN